MRQARKRSASPSMAPLHVEGETVMGCQIALRFDRGEAVENAQAHVGQHDARCAEPRAVRLDSLEVKVVCERTVEAGAFCNKEICAACGCHERVRPACVA